MAGISRNVLGHGRLSVRICTAIQHFVLCLMAGLLLSTQPALSQDARLGPGQGSQTLKTTTSVPAESIEKEIRLLTIEAEVLSADDNRPLPPSLAAMGEMYLRDCTDISRCNSEVLKQLYSTGPSVGS